MDTNLPAVCQNNILLLSGCVSRAARELLQSQISLSNPSRADQAPKSFTFDAVYDETTQQKAFYEESCYDLVEGVMEGYNGTIFAYGQVSPCLFLQVVHLWLTILGDVLWRYSVLALQNIFVPFCVWRKGGAASTTTYVRVRRSEKS